MSFLSIRLDLESPVWLWGMRWLAIIGMTLAVLGAEVLGFKIERELIGSFLLALVLFNLFLPKLESYKFVSTDYFISFQIAIDLIVLTVILWHTGGVVNPFASFYVFHVLIAGLLLSPIMTCVVSIFATSLLACLIWSPPFFRNGVEYSLETTPLGAAMPLSLAILILVTSGFILVFVRRLVSNQQQIIQREKMAALGRMVGGFAHEIGTPLNSVLLIANDLKENVEGDTKSEAETIAREIRRCGDLVQLMLGFTGQQSNNLERIYEEVDCKPWLNELLQNYPNNPEIELRIASEQFSNGTKLQLPELVLRQVLLNLLKNSVQATRSAGIPRIVLDVGYKQKGLHVRVSDNGPGFSEGIRDKAFEAFFTTKDPGAGVGLGLYISYHMMQQVGGRISIQKDYPGEGAVMELWVPTGGEIQ